MNLTPIPVPASVARTQSVGGDVADDIETWALSAWTSQRQVEEWSDDPDNAELYRMSETDRRKFLSYKSRHLGWANSEYYFRRLGVPLAGKVIEQGAGCFWLSTYLSSFPDVTEVIGVELSKDRIRAFRDLSCELFPQHRRDKIRYVSGDMHALSVESDSVDIVASDAVLHHADNLVAVLRESWRVLKPGGWYVSLREPTISHLRPRPPLFHSRYPEDGSAMYYYLDGWRSAFLNGWFETVRTCHFMEYGLVRGRAVPWPIRRLLRAVDLRIPIKYYPKICIAAQKPLHPVR
jgi:SAM-dependent methyltransferase